MSHFRSLHRRQGEGHSFLLMQAITGCVRGARRKHAMQTVFIEQNSAKLATFMTSEYEGRSLKCCFGPLMIGISKRNFVYVCSTYECTRIRIKKKLLNYGFPEPYLPLSLQTSISHKEVFKPFSSIDYFEVCNTGLHVYLSRASRSSYSCLARKSSWFYV